MYFVFTDRLGSRDIEDMAKLNVMLEQKWKQKSLPKIKMACLNDRIPLYLNMSN